ncbi:MAG: DUF4249 domain-containing protein [Bacteroidota bacterium]
MKKIKIYQSVFLVLLVFFTHACVEQIDIETLTFEDVLVVEAIITNELKHQEIKLSRSIKFENEEPIYESNAEVKIIDDSNTYFFKEVSEGKYLSIEEFNAQPNRNYQLLITTKNGKSYVSKEVELTTVTQIDEVYASREIDGFGNEGISIFVDSYDPKNNSKYYRYEYEETYKIIAPYWSPFDMVVVDDRYIVKKLKTKEEKTCYNSLISNTIIQTETTGLTDDRVSKFEVRFIPRNDPIISHRYSIMVKQYVQSLDAYSYYKTLNKLSGGSGNIFSQNQPGFFNGNIFSKDNIEEKVIGFFEAASVSSKRIFFDYYDFFPEEALPPYFIECELFAPSTTMDAGDPSLLMELLKAGKVKYYMKNPNYPNPQNENEGKYYVVEAPCGDCTELGTNIKPDFWVD